jgi:hypothetical protein
MALTAFRMFVFSVSTTVATAGLATAKAQAPALIGSYSSTLTSADLKVPAGLPVDQMAGTWTVTFTADGRYTVKQNDAGHVSGTYVRKGDEVTLTDASGEFACTKGDDPSGVYRVAMAGGAVTFTKVKDASCPGRAAVLTAKAFQAAQ